MPLAFLLALQAAGMVVDWLGTTDQAKLMQSGEQLNQASVNANVATSRLQYEDESLQAMIKLRQNLGTQLAMQAARGVRFGTPSSALISNESIGNFNADERMRKINQLTNENALKAGGIISNLNTQANTQKNWNAFANRTIAKIPTSPSAWNQLGQGFSKENNYGFGLSKVGT